MLKIPRTSSLRATGGTVALGLLAMFAPGHTREARSPRPTRKERDVNHWEELTDDFRQAITAGLNERAADILAEFALAAPASRVRRHHRSLVEASARCTDERLRDHFLSVLELVRQRASMTSSSLVLLAPHTLDLPEADARLQQRRGSIGARLPVRG
jgi:hypothetical protein